MSTYTNELTAEIERVTLRGSPDKKTLQKLASIIWRMDQRLQVLEDEVVVDEKRKTFVPVEPPADVNEGPADIAANKETTNDGPFDVTARPNKKANATSVRGRAKKSQE